MKKKISELMKLCSGKFYIEFDPHKVYNETVLDYVEQPLDADVLDEMVKLDTVFRLEAHPSEKKLIDNSPNSVILYHYDLDKLLTEALNKLT